MNRKPPILTLVLLALAASTTLKAQSREGYTKDGTTSGVEYSHKIVNCNGKNVVYLHFNNTNKFPVTITWKEKFATAQVPEKKTGYRGEKSLTLLPGVSSPTHCDDADHSRCIVTFNDVDPTYIANIQQFEFENVTVESNKPQIK